MPLVSVGRLRFGASHAEVATVLGGEWPDRRTCRDYTWWSPAEFRHGVTAYYANGLLGMVAIHARYEPQVTYGHQALVGRVPPELEQWAIDQHLVHRFELRYSTFADPELFELGLIIRAQRAGDVMLTRPVMFAERVDVSWDVVPSEEWNQWW